MKKIHCQLAGLIIAMSLVSFAQAAYITDKLVAGLYENAAVDDSPLKALNSGTPLEVIDRKDEFIKVRTPDGTDGWVEAAYLTDEKPARSMLLELQAKNSTLKTQIDRLLEGKPLECDEAPQTAAEPVVETATVDAARYEALQADYAQLQEQNNQLHSQQQQIAAILQLSLAQPESSAAGGASGSGLVNWLAGLPGWSLMLLQLIILLAGAAIGYGVMRLRVIRRFGSIVRL